MSTGSRTDEDVLSELSRLQVHHAGARVLPDEKARFEAELRQTPERLEPRVRLSWSYIVESNPGLLLPHLRFFVERYPQMEGIGGWPTPMEARPALSRLWSAQSLLRGRDPRVRFNVHRFQTMPNQPSTSYGSPGWRTLKPERWMLERGHFFMDLGDAEDRQEHYCSAADAFKSALSLTQQPDSRESIVDLAALMSYRAGWLDDAASQAEEAVCATGFDAGCRRHIGHTVLGLIALRRQDEQAALAHLRLAATNVASLYLSDRGPMMELAARLFRRGHAESVAHFLRLLKKEWPEGTIAVDRWLAQIESGEPPSFLKYGDR